MNQPYAPTVIDRTVERVQRAAPMLTRVSDGLLVAIIAAFGLLDLATAGSMSFARSVTSGVWVVGTLALTGIAILAVLMRRTHLVPAMGLLCGASVALTATSFAIGVPMPPAFAALFALALMSARAVRFESAPTAIGCAIAGALAVAAESVRPGQSLTVLLLIICEFCFAVAVAGGAYLRLTDWRRSVAADAARQDERLQIARELHDLVGHYVTGIVVQAQAARHVAGQHPEATVVALEQIELAGGQAMESMRRMVGSLREDSPTAPGSTWDDLQIVVDRAAADGVPVRLRVDADADTLAASDDLAMSAHRIVSESLTNVRRHARDVTRVDVDVEIDRSSGQDRILVSIIDDGTAAGVSSHDTYGLIGMHERAEALGGSLYAGPAPSGGWLVRAELPVGITT